MGSGAPGAKSIRDLDDNLRGMLESRVCMAMGEIGTREPGLCALPRAPRKANPSPDRD